MPPMLLVGWVAPPSHHCCLRLAARGVHHTTLPLAADWLWKQSITRGLLIGGEGQGHDRQPSPSISGKGQGQAVPLTPSRSHSWAAAPWRLLALPHRFCRFHGQCWISQFPQNCDFSRFLAMVYLLYWFVFRLLRKGNPLTTCLYMHS